MSGDIACSQNAISFGNRDLSEFDKTDAEIDKEFPHATPFQLSYKCTDPLPDGALFIPQAMEDKFAILFKKDKILIIRSWTATIDAVVYVNRIGDTLTLTSLRSVDEKWPKWIGLDFLIRSHVLRQVAVAPMSEKKSEDPNLYFSYFGRRVLFAAPAEDVAKIEYDTKATPILRTESATERALKNREALDKLQRLATEAAEKGELNVPGSFSGYSILHGACAMANVELVRFLLKLGADRTVLSDQGHTPFMEACSIPGFSPELGDALLEGAPAGYVDLTGRADRTTALHFAAQNSNLPLVEYLVSRGADVNALDKGHFGALHRAAEQGAVEIVKLLLEKGADKTQRSLSSSLNPAGWLPLELAKRSRGELTAQAPDRKSVV